MFLVFVATHATAKHGLDLNGGVSGGGGFVISPETPDQYVSPDKVESLIEKQAEPCLENYLINKKKKFDNGELPGHEFNTLEPILKQGVIFKTIKNTRLIVVDGNSCFGSNGEPTDGSFFKDKKKAICISAKNLAEKVHHKELKPQTLALMMHEYSEMLGFSEDEAVSVQKIVLEDLKNSGAAFRSEY